MSEFWEAIILGIVQGITEFLPVSSSGHIEIAEYLLDSGVQNQSVSMTIVLHFATALATIIYFWKTVWNIIKNIKQKKEWNYILMIIISMIPAGIVGVFFDEIISGFFDGRILLVAFGLFITGLLLLVASRSFYNKEEMTPLKSLVMGVAQAIALVPGISRSGATISTALVLKVNRLEAAQFSFLMVVPLIFGKMLKDIVSEDMIFTQTPLYYTIGFLAAFIVGILSCAFMVKIVQNAKLIYFSAYCFIVSFIIFALSLL